MGYGTIVSATDNYSYALTSDDVLWAGRMLAGEGGNHAATLWTMTQRAVVADVGKPGSRYPTLTSLLRGYSQPISERWVEGGDRCPVPVPGSTWCSPEKLARREAMVTRSWSSLPEDIRAVVSAWADGKLPNPVPGAVHFRANDATARAQIAAGTHIPVLTAGNVYTAVPETRSWSRDRVTIKAGSSGMLYLAMGGALAGVGALAYLWLSKRR
jgi:hypothetical protein